MQSPQTSVPMDVPADTWRVIYVAAYAVTASIVIATLYFGSEVIQPLAVAALLSFVLSPLIRLLVKTGLGKTPSVILAVVIALGILVGLSVLMARQVTNLAAELPRYELNLREKIQAIKAYTVTSGALQKASETLDDLKDELQKQDVQKTDQADPSTAQLPASPTKPVPVELRTEQPAFFEQFGTLVSPLLKPVAQTALVILFLLFILLQREDLRDRALRLAGTADLQRSTLAMKDAGKRLSRFFLLQTALNTGFGVAIAIGLWIIGVPTPLLWGMLAGLMRFVPFIGSIIAAVFPIALAAAVDPGWTMVFATGALFLTLEPLAGHIIEPLVYGQNTGLSPLAVVVATIFWTLLWGPVGLLLATPLTLCLVVLGKYVPGLSLLHVMLGDEPALSPVERLYQRLLVGDVAEAVEQADDQLETQSLIQYQDGVVMKALLLAHADTAENRIAPEHGSRFSSSMREMLDDLEGEDADEQSNETGKTLPIISSDSLQPEFRDAAVLCIPARSDIDEAACHVLTDLLRRHGLKAASAPFEAGAAQRHFVFDPTEHRIVCISCFGANSNSAHARYIARRIRKQDPTVRIIACFWSTTVDAGSGANSGAFQPDALVTNFRDAVATCQRFSTEQTAREMPQQLAS